MLDLTNNINENNHEIQFLATKLAKVKKDIEKQSFLSLFLCIASNNVN